MYIPKPLYIWLILSSFVVIYDASYVLLRPDTMVGGKYFQYFSAYDLYIKFDTLYGNLTDSFVVIQSWLNLVQVTLILGACLLSFSSCEIKKLVSAIVIVVASAFVFWKTVIYLWYSHDFTTQAVKNLTKDAILYFLLPSSFWIIFPLLSIFLISKRIITNQKSVRKLKNA